MQYRNWLQYQFSFHLFLGGNRLSFQSFHLYRPVLVPGLAPVKGYVLTDSDDDGVEQKNLVLKEPGYTVDNTFEINEVLDTKMESTLEDLFDKKYLIQAVSEHYELDIELDEKKPLIAQVKKFLHDNHKPYKDEDKEILRHSYFEQVSKLDKDALKKERYFEFATILCSKIKA